MNTIGALTSLGISNFYSEIPFQNTVTALMNLCWRFRDIPGLHNIIQPATWQQDYRAQSVYQIVRQTSLVEEVLSTTPATTRNTFSREPWILLVNRRTGDNRYDAKFTTSRSQAQVESWTPRDKFVVVCKKKAPLRHFHSASGSLVQLRYEQPLDGQ